MLSFQPPQTNLSISNFPAPSTDIQSSPNSFLRGYVLEQEWFIAELPVLEGLVSLDGDVDMAVNCWMRR